MGDLLATIDRPRTSVGSSEASSAETRNEFKKFISPVNTHQYYVNNLLTAAESVRNIEELSIPEQDALMNKLQGLAALEKKAYSSSEDKSSFALLGKSIDQFADPENIKAFGIDGVKMRGELYVKNTTPKVLDLTDLGKQDNRFLDFVAKSLLGGIDKTELTLENFLDSGKTSIAALSAGNHQGQGNALVIGD